MNAAQYPRFIAQKIAVARGDRLLLTDINFSLQASQLLRIVGENGSGKTSLLRIIAGLSEAESGTLRWLDSEQTSHHHHEKNTSHYISNYTDNIAYIGHRDGLKNTLSAIENLRFYQQLHQDATSAERGVVNDTNESERLLHQLKLLDHADVLAGSLSFGQRRRLAFARLLLASQPLWLLDEPFTGIDIEGRTLIESICEQHLQAGGMIIMTHHGSLDGSLLGPYESQLNLMG